MGKQNEHRCYLRSGSFSGTVRHKAGSLDGSAKGAKLEMIMRDRLGIWMQIPALLLLGVVWSGVVGLNKMRAWDSNLTAWAYMPQQRFAWRLFSRAGDGWVYVLMYLALRSWGGIVEAKQLAAAVFLAWGISAALKLTIRRRRVNPRIYHRRALTKLASWSFPSQHAACAVAFACAIWPNPTGVVFAVLVCVSRVLIGAHYLSDVLAGVGVGLLAWRLA
jgi:undecaprenyl-diphosphatase